MRFHLVIMVVLAALALAGCRESAEERAFSGQWRAETASAEISFSTRDGQRFMTVTQSAVGMSSTTELPFPVSIRDGAVYGTLIVGEQEIMRLENGYLFMGFARYSRP